MKTLEESNKSIHWYIGRLEALTEYNSEFSGDLLSIRKHIDGQAARIRELEAEREWLPISESPGSKEKYYLCKCESKTYDYEVKPYQVILWVGSRNQWNCSAGIEITHWQHLPKPPQPKQEK